VSAGECVCKYVCTYLCALPTAMSNPISPTGLRMTEAKRSVIPTCTHTMMVIVIAILLVQSDDYNDSNNERSIDKYSNSLKFI
jgi:hypothetical protein